MVEVRSERQAGISGNSAPGRAEPSPLVRDVAKMLADWEGSLEREGKLYTGLAEELVEFVRLRLSKPELPE